MILENCLWVLMVFVFESGLRSWGVVGKVDWMT